MVPRGSEANPIYLTLHTYLHATPLPRDMCPSSSGGQKTQFSPICPQPGHLGKKHQDPMQPWTLGLHSLLLPSQAPPWEVTFPYRTTFLLPSTRMLAGGPDGGAQWKKGQAPLKALLQQQRPGRHKGRKAQRPPLGGGGGRKYPGDPAPRDPGSRL